MWAYIEFSSIVENKSFVILWDCKVFGELENWVCCEVFGELENRLWGVTLIGERWKPILWGVNVVRVNVENPVVIVEFFPGVGSGDVGRKVRTPWSYYLFEFVFGVFAFVFILYRHLYIAHLFHPLSCLDYCFPLC